MNPSVKNYEQYYDDHNEEIFDDFFKYLSFASISTNPKYKESLLQCAEWLIDYLKDMDLNVSLWKTSNHPSVFAENLKAGEEKPTVLIYLHYDVQPVDPLELWDSPPFEPTLKQDEVYARGASDNKGQAFYTLTALKAILDKEKKYPVNIKLIIEGGEEIGSPGLYSILDAKKSALKADHLLIVDCDIPDIATPTINVGCRGCCTLELELTGSKGDLHSGLYGGVVYNPLRALCEMFSKIHDLDGKVTIPGFYDDLKILTDEEKKELYLDLDYKAFEKEHQTIPNGGESEFSPLERMGLRPTFEINGMWGGYTDKGFKTVIPAKAFAKVSMRLIPNQDPQKVTEKFSKYIQTLVPEGLVLKIKSHSDPAPAYWCSFNSTLAQAAQWAFEQATEKPCLKYMGGGSLPIAADLAKAAQAETLCLGTALSTDQIHAPNEHFSKKQFKMGYLVITQLLEKLSTIQA